MPQLSNLSNTSHCDLVALAEQLMGEMPDELFLPEYDAALAAEDDLPLVRLCRKLMKIAPPLARTSAAA
jgi:hypothetical protein